MTGKLLLEQLSARNRCIEKMRELSRNFADQPGETDLVLRAEQLEQRRAAIIKTIELFDRQIAQTISRLSPAERTSALIDTVRKMEHQKDVLFSQMVQADGDVAQRIQAFCQQLESDLVNTRRSQSQLNRFKSQWVAPVGEEIDSSL